MSHSRYVVLAFLIPLLVLSWLLIAGLGLEGSPQVEHLVIGYLIGTMFGQATLASAWAALGPAPLLWRLPISLGWVAVLTIAFIVNIAANGHGANVEVALIMGGCVAGQWFLVQLPMWGLALGYGVRLRHRSDPPESIRERQFGIRQLMILTTIVAVVLGIARVAVAGAITQLGQGDSGQVAVFIFLAAAGIVLTLPLLMAALLPRMAWLATAVVLVLIAMATWYELPLVQMVYSRGGGPNMWHLTFINAFQAAWVILVAALLRLCGFGIRHPVGESPFASKA